MIWIVLLLIVALAVVLLWLSSRRKKKLPAAAKNRILSQWSAVQTIADPHRKILEADAVIHQLLGVLGHEGTMADRLKKAGDDLPGLQQVWAAHKLRNRIAHESGMQLSDRDVASALRAFSAVIGKYCK